MSKHDPHYAPEPPEHPDQWHRHTPDEGAPQDEHVPQANPYLLAGIMGVLTVSFIALLIVVVLYYFQYTTKIRREKMENTTPSKESYDYRNELMKKLDLTAKIDPGTYAWADLASGSEAVQIPLDQAVDKVLNHYASGRGH